MAFEIKKQNKETNQALVRRFTKRLRESGILRAVKKAMFLRRKESKYTQRQSTLRKLEKRTEYEKLKKLGKI